MFLLSNSVYKHTHTHTHTHTASFSLQYTPAIKYLSVLKIFWETMAQYGKKFPCENSLIIVKEKNHILLDIMCLKYKDKINLGGMEVN